MAEKVGYYLEQANSFVLRDVVVIESMWIVGRCLNKILVLFLITANATSRTLTSAISSLGT